VLGTLRLPLILLATGDPITAAGTNIAISTVAAGTGGVRHAREGRVSWKVVAAMAPPSVVGAVLGAVVVDDVPLAALYGAIAAVLVWSAVDLAFRPVRPVSRPRLRLGAAAGSGLVIGALGGAIGVILGTLRMPALLRSVGLDIRLAAGTNLVVGFLLGLAGFVAHAAVLNVDGAVLVAGLLGAAPGAWIGARLTGVVSDESLRLALAVTLAVIGAAFAIQAVLE
jgi:hypothetical protein